MQSPFPFRLMALIASILLPVEQSRAEDFQGAGHALSYEQGVIGYSTRAPMDPVAKLQERIDKGEATLTWDEHFGYLPAVLEALAIPRSSQTLVFSKTSFQRRLIGPRNPRALYFNDDAYLGYIPHAPSMEISAVDPNLGGVFYVLAQEKTDRPKFERNADCLSCHGGDRSLGVPGHILRSIGTDADGELDSHSEVSGIDHCTPLADRWAGWYVTGAHGAQAHRGNLIGSKAWARQLSEPNALGNLTDLSRFFETTNYLTPRSDIGALMVLEHQAHMHNYLTRLRFETLQMMETYGHIRYLKSQVNAFLRYLLFTEEAPLASPIQGDAEFVRDFTEPGRRDAQGRSLRDVDLQTRLFKYPCSFLIESPAFDSLPDVMREHVLQRLFDILVGRDKDPQFARIRADDRQAILEILRQTKPNLPSYWREG